MTIRTILVDDNKTFLAAVRNFLAMVPDVTIIGEAHDGKSGLELAFQTLPDLVLLDIAMPGMNGLEVAQLLKEFLLPPNIIFLSMHDNAAYRLAARELGAYGYVGKGDFVAALIPIIDRLARSINGQETDNPGAAGSLQ